MEDHEQNTKDIEEMRTGREMFEALTDMFRLHGKCLNKDDMVELDKEMKLLLLPSSIKNISAVTLKRRLFNDYVIEASRLMNTAFKDRETHFIVRRKDIDILALLEENWDDKKIKHDVEYEQCSLTSALTPIIHVVNGVGYIRVKLSW